MKILYYMPTNLAEYLDQLRADLYAVNKLDGT
jgi:hypothetical protein